MVGSLHFACNSLGLLIRACHASPFLFLTQLGIFMGCHSQQTTGLLVHWRFLFKLTICYNNLSEYIILINLNVLSSLP